MTSFYAVSALSLLFNLSIEIYFSLICRRGNRRDACCCCITLSETYEPFACSKVDRLQKFFDTVVAKFIVKLPVKVSLQQNR